MAPRAFEIAENVLCFWRSMLQGRKRGVGGNEVRKSQRSGAAKRAAKLSHVIVHTRNFVRGRPAAEKWVGNANHIWPGRPFTRGPAPQLNRCKAARAALLLGLTVTARW